MSTIDTLTNRPFDLALRQFLFFGKVSTFIRLAGLLFLGEFSVIGAIALIPNGIVNLHVTALEGNLNLWFILLLIDLAAPAYETLFLVWGIKILKRMRLLEFPICLISGIVFGALHFIDDGAGRFVITGYAFCVFSFAYFVFKLNGFSRPALGVIGLHATNNFVASFGILSEIVLNRFG